MAITKFQPPPTYAMPVIEDPRTRQSVFNPIWLKWFLDLSQNLGTEGAGGGTVTQITTGAGLSGGTITGVGTISLADIGTPGTYTKVTTNVRGQVVSGQTQIDLSTDVTGNLAVARLNGGSGATSSTYWRGDGTWAPASTSGGTVTSVALTLPTQFFVGGSPVTSSGTLTATWNTQVTNYVFAGPASGLAAVPTFRALVAADIPALSYVSSISVDAPITSTGGLTPTIGITQSTASTDGYLSSTDWNTFNGKQPAGAYLTSVAVTAPITGDGVVGTPLAMAAASSTVDGYLTSTDWNTFNNKQPAGTYVTSISVASANGLAGTSSGGATPELTLSTSITGILKGNGTAISAATAGTDYLVPSAPVTKTADFTVAATEQWIINNKTSACIVTLPAAASFAGRSLTFQNYQAFALSSAASDVVPQGGGAASTAILLGVAGNWATLVSDGSNWVIMQAAAFNNLLLE